MFDLEPLFKKKKHSLFLEFIAKGTPNNQLFLTEIGTRKVKDNVHDIADLLNVIDWFQNSLKVIFPGDKYNEGIKSELKDDSKLLDTYEELLSYFDTGINGTCLEKIEFESIEIPKGIMEKIKEHIILQPQMNYG